MFFGVVYFFGNGYNVGEWGEDDIVFWQCQFIIQVWLFGGDWFFKYLNQDRLFFIKYLIDFIGFDDIWFYFEVVKCMSIDFV